MTALAAALILAAAAPEHSMSEVLIESLDRALQGDPQALKGLGIERAVITSPSWDDRTSVDGAGDVTFKSRRAGADRGGTPIGDFRTTLSKEELQAVIRGLRAVVAATPPPMRAEPYEARVLLEAVIEGRLYRYGTKAFPTALEPLQPLLMPLNAAVQKAYAKPVRSLTLSLETSDSAPRAGAVTATLRLRNGGEEGFWVSNPAALPNQKEHERAEMVYAAPLVFTPGVSPVPVTPRRTLLAPRGPARDEARYCWIPPKGELSVQLQGHVEAPADAKQLVLRAELYLDEGADEIAGQPRLRGSVFSEDVTVTVR
jgi:hypothetical protein